MIILNFQNCTPCDAGLHARRQIFQFVLSLWISITEYFHCRPVVLVFSLTQNWHENQIFSTDFSSLVFLTDITKRITDISNVLQRDKKCAVGDSSKYASTVGRRFSSSSLLSSSTNSNSVTSSNSELPRSPFLTSHSNCLSSSRDDGCNQTKFGSTQRPVDTNLSSPLQQFTQTRKVGTTHVFPDNLRRLGGVRNDTVDGSCSSSNDVTVSAQSR